jgi:hypothetical protein
MIVSNPEEAEAARAALQKFEREEAQKAQDAKAERFKPLTDLIESKGFKETVKTLEALHTDYREFPNVDVHLQPLTQIIVRFRDAVATEVQPSGILMLEPAPPAAPPQG